MKKIIIIGIIIAIFSNCKAQQKKNKLKNPKIMKTFDIETFNRNKNNENQYFFSKRDGTIIKQYHDDIGYREIIQPKNSLFEDYVEYYENGKVEKFLKSFQNDFVTGIMKEYDKQGNLIKEIDLDKPYTYTWENVKEYLKEHKVANFHKDIINISRWSDEEETTWTLAFKGEYKNIKGQFLIELDGKTGEELEVKLFKGKKALGKDGTIADYKIIYKKN